MTKREFVEQAAMQIRAGLAISNAPISGERAEHAVAEAELLWNEIEKKVPRDKNLDFLGGSRQ
jgi:hypothetical protein